MSEFKGTKGKWVVEKTHEKGKWIQNEDGGYCAVSAGSTLEESKANALLISKAPEMLEMLNRVLNDVDFSSTLWGNDAGIILSEEIEQLIKEATEL